MRYQVRLAAHIRTDHPSGYDDIPEQRTQVLHDMFRYDVNSALCAIGGNASNYLLEHLNFASARTQLKLFIVSIDISVFHTVFWVETGLGWISGPALHPHFRVFGGSIRSFLDVAGITSSTYMYPISGHIVTNTHQWDARRITTPGDANPINLESLLSLVGTMWFPPPADAILCTRVVEITSAARVLQILTHLRHVCGLHDVARLVLGRVESWSLLPLPALREMVHETHTTDVIDRRELRLRSHRSYTIFTV